MEPWCGTSWKWSGALSGAVSMSAIGWWWCGKTARKSVNSERGISSARALVRVEQFWAMGLERSGSGAMGDEGSVGQWGRARFASRGALWTPHKKDSHSRQRCRTAPGQSVLGATPNLPPQQISTTTGWRDMAAGRCHAHGGHWCWGGLGRWGEGWVG